MTQRGTDTTKRDMPPMLVACAASVLCRSAVAGLIAPVAGAVMAAGAIVMLAGIAANPADPVANTFAENGLSLMIDGKRDQPVLPRRHDHERADRGQDGKEPGPVGDPGIHPPSMREG